MASIIIFNQLYFFKGLFIIGWNNSTILFQDGLLKMELYGSKCNVTNDYFIRINYICSYKSYAQNTIHLIVSCKKFLYSFFRLYKYYVKTQKFISVICVYVV